MKSTVEMHRINKKQDFSHLMSGRNSCDHDIYVCSDSKTIREGFNLGKKSGPGKKREPTPAATFKMHFEHQHLGAGLYSVLGT